MKIFVQNKPKNKDYKIEGPVLLGNEFIITANKYGNQWLDIETTTFSSIFLKSNGALFIQPTGYYCYPKTDAEELELLLCYDGTYYRSKKLGRIKIG